MGRQIQETERVTFSPSNKHVLRIGHRPTLHSQLKAIHFDFVIIVFSSSTVQSPLHGYGKILQEHQHFFISVDLMLHALSIRINSSEEPIPLSNPINSRVGTLFLSYRARYEWGFGHGRARGHSCCTREGSRNYCRKWAPISRRDPFHI